MMKVFLISFFIFALGACAQNRKIIDAKAYFKQSMHGARLIIIDSNGMETERPPDTLHLLYLLLKTSDGTPEIDTVHSGNWLYWATIESVSDKDTQLGKTRVGSQPVYLKRSKGTTWWLLLMTPLQHVSSSAESRFIILKGRVKHKTFTLKINQETELEPDIPM